MSLKPLEIANHEFARSMRGYDSEEVRAFLGHISDEVYALKKQIAELKKSGTSPESKSATPTPEDVNAARQQVEQEREEVLREAQAEAEELKLAAQREVEAMHEELLGLKLQRDGYVKRFRFLIKSQVELLDLLESESPEKEDSDARVEEPDH